MPIWIRQTSARALGLLRKATRSSPPGSGRLGRAVPSVEEGTDDSGVRYGRQQRPADDDQHPRSEPSVIADTLRLHLCVSASESQRMRRAISSELNIARLEKEAEEPQGGLFGELG